MAKAEGQKSALWAVGVCLLCLSANVSAATVTNQGAINCIRTLTCQFEENACGFRDSVNWNREHGSSGYYQRYEYVEGTATDLVSPPLCNSAIDVHFSCVIFTSNATTDVTAELHVLTECDDNTESVPHVVTASKELSSAWKNVSLTLPSCPSGQTLHVVFRAWYALPDSLILLDNVHMEINSKQPGEQCIHTLSCLFGDNTCGFLDSMNWRLENSSSGYYQRYKYVEGTATDLVSPPLCNSAIDVHFSCVIFTSNATTGVPAELHVLTECDDNTESVPHVITASKELSSAWKNVSLTLQACPSEQNPSVVFRAVLALPGSVIKLDKILLQTRDASTTMTEPTTTAKLSTPHTDTTREMSTRHSMTRTSSPRHPSTTSPNTRASLTSVSTRPEMTSIPPDVHVSTQSSAAEMSTQTEAVSTHHLKSTVVTQKRSPSAAAVLSTSARPPPSSSSVQSSVSARHRPHATSPPQPASTAPQHPSTAPLPASTAPLPASTPQASRSSSSPPSVGSRTGGSDDKERLIIGVVLGVCTAVFVVAVIVLVFRRMRYLARQEDKKIMIKMNQRFANPEQPLY
ncbi:uncharacterized protein LOC143282172 [Babylonia areolata]|uniref:uncharacterized protein LOC143282172 n=1 Tax=Babylonia areolata TaxID=304850 RepID=UPI003FD446F9